MMLEEGTMSELYVGEGTGRRMSNCGARSGVVIVGVM